MDLQLSPFSRGVKTEFTNPWDLVDPWATDLRHVRSGLMPIDRPREEFPIDAFRRPEHTSALTGFSLWAAADLGIEVWFEWFELKRNVVTLRAPMQIQANVAFMDKDGKPASRAIVPTFLVSVVNRLSWQDSALECLLRLRGGGRGSVPKKRALVASTTH